MFLAISWMALTMAGAHEGWELATVARTQGSAEVHQWRWVQKDVEDLGTKRHPDPPELRSGLRSSKIS